MRPPKTHTFILHTFFIHFHTLIILVPLTLWFSRYSRPCDVDLKDMESTPQEMPSAAKKRKTASKSTSSPAYVKMQKPSVIYTYFDVEAKSDGKLAYKCKTCGYEGTTTKPNKAGQLRKHIKHHHGDMVVRSKKPIVKAMRKQAQKRNSMNRNSIVRKLVTLLILNGIAFNVVTKPEFRDFMTEMVPDWEAMRVNSRGVIVREIKRMRKEEEMMIKSELEGVEYVSVSCDEWASRQCDTPFVSVVIYYCKKGRTFTRLLDLVALPDGSSSPRMAEVVFDTLCRFGLEGKAVILTTDGASSMLGITVPSGWDSKERQSHGRYLQWLVHSRCGAHLLNLGLKNTSVRVSSESADPEKEVLRKKDKNPTAVTIALDTMRAIARFIRKSKNATNAINLMQEASHVAHRTGAPDLSITAALAVFDEKVWPQLSEEVLAKQQAASHEGAVQERESDEDAGTGAATGAAGPSKKRGRSGALIGGHVGGAIGGANEGSMEATMEGTAATVNMVPVDDDWELNPDRVAWLDSMEEQRLGARVGAGLDSYEDDLFGLGDDVLDDLEDCGTGLSDWDFHSIVEDLSATGRTKRVLTWAAARWSSNINMLIRLLLLWRYVVPVMMMVNATRKRSGKAAIPLPSPSQLQLVRAYLITVTPAYGYLRALQHSSTMITYAYAHAKDFISVYLPPKTEIGVLDETLDETPLTSRCLKPLLLATMDPSFAPSAFTPLQDTAKAVREAIELSFESYLARDPATGRHVYAPQSVHHRSVLLDACLTKLESGVCSCCDRPGFIYDVFEGLFSEDERGEASLEAARKALTRTRKVITETFRHLAKQAEERVHGFGLVMAASALHLGARKDWSVQEMETYREALWSVIKKMTDAKYKPLKRDALEAQRRAQDAAEEDAETRAETENGLSESPSLSPLPSSASSSSSRAERLAEEQSGGDDDGRGGERSGERAMAQGLIAMGLNPDRLSFAPSVSSAQAAVAEAKATVFALEQQEEKALASFQIAIDALFGTMDGNTCPFLGTPDTPYFQAVLAVMHLTKSPLNAVAYFWCLLAEGCDPGKLVRTNGTPIPLNNLGMVEATGTMAGAFDVLLPVAPMLATIATAPFCSTVDERAFSVASLFYTPFRQLLSQIMGSSQVVLKMNTIFRRAEQKNTEEEQVIAQIVALTK